MTAAARLGSGWTRSRARALAGGVPGRLVAALSLAALAAHYSLATLAGAWRYQTPLADLILVPVIAAGLFVAAAMRHPSVGSTRLRRIDLVTAGVGLGLAATVLVVLPVLLANYFWAVRLDLLTVPLVAMAAVALLFGTRTIVAFLFPLAFLALVWPLPHQMLLEQALGHVTDLTSLVVQAVVEAVPVAELVPGGADLRLLVPSGDGGFMVTLASACSGTESLVGFGLVGTAAMYLVRGPVRRRLAWLAAGAAAVWLGNLARILALLAVGRAFGPDLALGALHPVAGVVVLNLVFVLMVAVLPRFGLRRRRLRDQAAADSPVSRPEAPAAGQARRRAQVPLRLAGLTLAVALLAAADANLAGVATAWSNEGHPVGAAFPERPSAGPHWNVEAVDRFDSARPYFGGDSNWVRYRLFPTDPDAGDPFTIWADSISTSSYGALLAHPVAACYRWHRFDVLSHERVQVTGGILGERLVFQRPGGGLWHVLTWEWPVAAGDRLRHERMVLLASTGQTAPQPVRSPDANPVAGLVLTALNALARDDDPNPGLSQALLTAAGEVVHARMAAATGTTGGP